MMSAERPLVACPACRPSHLLHRSVVLHIDGESSPMRTRRAADATRKTVS